MKLMFVFFLLSFSIAGKVDPDPITIVPKEAKMNLQTANGCWIFSHPVLTVGDTASGKHSYFGYLNNYSTEFIKVDSFFFDHPKILYPDVEFQYQHAATAKPLYIISNSKLYEYSINDPTGYYPQIILKDSFPVPNNFLDAFALDDNTLLIVNEINNKYNYTFYTTPGLHLDFMLELGIKPEFFRNYHDRFMIIGDSAGTRKLIEVDINNKIIKSNNEIKEQFSEILEFARSNQSYYYLTNRADTAVAIGYFNSITPSDTIFDILNNTWATGSFDDRFDKFYFQPQNFIDTSLNSSLLAFDYKTSLISDTIALNRNAKLIWYSISDYSYGPRIFISGQEYLYVYRDFFYNLSDYDSIFIGSEVLDIKGDFRCLLGIEEIEQHLQIDIYPVPSGNEVNITIKGMVSNKSYKIDIIDVSGKQMWETEVQAKNDYTIPLDKLPDGLLILRIHTDSKTVSKKFIKQ